MKLIEIAERLKAEFPGQYVAFGASCYSFSHGGTEVSITLQAEADNHHVIKCDDLEDGIAKLKSRLGMSDKAKTFDVDV